MEVKLKMYLTARGLALKDVTVVNVKEILNNLDVTGRVVVVTDKDIVKYDMTSDLQTYVYANERLAKLKERLVKNASIN